MGFLTTQRDRKDKQCHDDAAAKNKHKHGQSGRGQCALWCVVCLASLLVWSLRSSLAPRPSLHFASNRNATNATEPLARLIQ